MRAEELACRNCRWWTNLRSKDMPEGIRLMKTCDTGETETVEGGVCHRYAPHSYIANTREDHWCGDFDPKGATD